MLLLLQSIFSYHLLHNASYLINGYSYLARYAITVSLALLFILINSCNYIHYQYLHLSTLYYYTYTISSGVHLIHVYLHYVWIHWIALSKSYIRITTRISPSFDLAHIWLITLILQKAYEPPLVRTL